MSRKITQAELERNRDLLASRKPIHDKMDAEKAAQSSEWEKEIQMLERRANTSFIDLELSNGDKLAIRSSLSLTDTDRIDALRMEQSTNNDKERMREISYEIVEIITANPLITKAWLKKNPRKFALNDILACAFAFYQQQVYQQREEMERIKKAFTFREE